MLWSFPKLAIPGSAVIQPRVVFRGEGGACVFLFARRRSRADCQRLLGRDRTSRVAVHRDSRPAGGIFSQLKSMLCSGVSAKSVMRSSFTLREACREFSGVEISGLEGRDIPLIFQFCCAKRSIAFSNTDCIYRTSLVTVV